MSEQFKAMMQADLAAAVADVSAALKYAGIVVTGTAGPAGSTDAASADGILPQADLEFVAPLDDFGDKLPRVRDVVAVDGEKYWVERIENDGAVATLRLRRG